MISGGSLPGERSGVTPLFRRLACGGLLAIAVLAGCGKPDPAAMVASARTYMAKADYKAAVIQLKNALQQQPNNPETRYLLAVALLDSGDAPSAETEIRKAIDLKYSGEQAYPILARSMLAQGQYRKVILEFGTRTLQTPEGRGDLDTSVAIAHRALGENKDARAKIDVVLAEQAKSPRAMQLKSMLLAQENDLDGALKLADAAVAAAPSDSEAVVLKAEIENTQGRRDQAIKTLEKGIEAKPDAMQTRFALMSLLVSSAKTDEAVQQLEAMRKIAPQDFRTLYSDALVSLARNDPTHARETIQRVLAAAPDNLPSLYLSGLINYQLQSYAQAEESLRKVVAQAPADINARRVLAATYLRTGRSAQALEVLNPALRRSPDDPSLLRVAAEAYLVSGNANNAAQLYERANTIDKNDVASKVRLAQVRFATGDTARAFSDLEKLSQSDTEHDQADLALITAHLRRREFDQALAALNALEKKQPPTALTNNLRGVIHMSKRDSKAARAAFDKALVADPKYFSAAYNLAMIDAQEGKGDEARKRYEDILAKDPKNEQVLIALAELTGLTGGSRDQVKAALDRAIDANPRSPQPRLAKVTYFLRLRDPKGALEAAQAAQVVLPDDASIVEALGAAQLASGNSNQAVDSYKRLAKMQPENPVPLLRLAEANIVAKDIPAAIEAERKALAIRPDFPEAWVALAQTFLMSGRPDDAIAEARKLQKERPDRALGWALEGEILASQKKWPEAVSVYRKGLEVQKLPLLATKLYLALQSAGKPDEASALSARWLKENPKDLTFREMLAQQSQSKKDYKSAVAQYRDALDVAPENVALLNNMAWVLGEMGDPKARDYAERAYALAPFNPAVIDTLGWTLVRTNDPVKGAQLLRLASNLAPTDNEIRMHLAKALVKNGDKTAARAQLEPLSKLDKASPLRADAEKMLGEL